MGLRSYGNYQTSTLQGIKGLAAVYAARQVGTSEDKFAVKVLEASASQPAREKFLKSIQVQSVLSSASTGSPGKWAPVCESGRTEGGDLFYVSRLFTKKLNLHLHHENAKARQGKLYDVVLSVVEGLEHAKKTLAQAHRNISPNNVLISELPSGRVSACLTDPDPSARGVEAYQADLNSLAKLIMYYVATRPGPWQGADVPHVTAEDWSRLGRRAVGWRRLADDLKAASCARPMEVDYVLQRVKQLKPESDMVIWAALGIVILIIGAIVGYGQYCKIVRQQWVQNVKPCEKWLPQLLSLAEMRNLDDLGNAFLSKHLENLNLLNLHMRARPPDRKTFRSDLRTLDAFQKDLKKLQQDWHDKYYSTFKQADSSGKHYEAAWRNGGQVLDQAVISPVIELNGDVLLSDRLKLAARLIREHFTVSTQGADAKQLVEAFDIIAKRQDKDKVLSCFPSYAKAVYTKLGTDQHNVPELAKSLAQYLELACQECLQKQGKTKEILGKVSKDLDVDRTRDLFHSWVYLLQDVQTQSVEAGEIWNSLTKKALVSVDSYIAKLNGLEYQPKKQTDYTKRRDEWKKHIDDGRNTCCRHCAAVKAEEVVEKGKPLQQELAQYVRSLETVPSDPDPGGPLRTVIPTIKSLGDAGKDLQTRLNNILAKVDIDRPWRLAYEQKILEEYKNNKADIDALVKDVPGMDPVALMRELQQMISALKGTAARDYYTERLNKIPVKSPVELQELQALKGKVEEWSKGYDYLMGLSYVGIAKEYWKGQRDTLVENMRYCEKPKELSLDGDKEYKRIEGWEACFEPLTPPSSWGPDANSIAEAQRLSVLLATLKSNPGGPSPENPEIIAWDTWRANAEKIFDQHLQVDAAIGECRLLDELYSSSGETIRKFVSKFVDTPRSGDIYTKFDKCLKPIYAKAKRLVEMEKLPPSELTRIGKSLDMDEPAIYAWRCLGKVQDWPATIGQMQAEHAIQSNLQSRIGLQETRKDELQKELDDESDRRWKACLNSLLRPKSDWPNWEHIRECVDKLKPINLKGGTLAKDLEPAADAAYLWFKEVLPALKAEAERKVDVPNDQKGREAFVEKVAVPFENNAVVKKSQQDRLVSQMLSYLKQIRSGSSPSTISKGLEAAGWRLEQQEDPDVRVWKWKPKHRPRHEHILVFRRLKQTGSYLCTSEMTLDLFRDVLKEANKSLELLQDIDVGWHGPRCWGLSDHLGVNDNWLRDDPKFTERPVPESGQYACYYPGYEVDKYKPSESSPMNYVSPNAAIAAATLLKCRLPYLKEWKAACAENENDAKFNVNLRDGNVWLKQQTHIRDSKANPGIEAIERLQYPVGDFVFGGELGPDAKPNERADKMDKHLWFAKNEPHSPRFQHLIGNVAEMIIDDSVPLDKDGKEVLNKPKCIKVIGGSALSSPQVKEDEPAQWDQPDKGVVNMMEMSYCDVGFRLAYSAPMEPFRELAKRILKECGYSAGTE